MFQFKTISLSEFMTKYSLFFCFFVFAIASGWAQDTKSKYGMAGYKYGSRDFIVQPAGDTLYGDVQYGAPAMRTVRIDFKAEGQKEYLRMEPFMVHSWYASELEYPYESKVIKLSSEEAYGYSVFMQRILDGEVQLLEFWNGFGERGFIQTFLQRKSEKNTLFEVAYLKMNRQMVDYFDDFPQLVAKIERMAFKKNFKGLVQMVNEYNIWKKQGW